MSPPRRYAEGTTVAASRSRLEVDEYLTKRGATAIAIHVEEGLFAVMFRKGERLVRFVVDRPRLEGRGTVRQRENRREREERRRWRALLLVLRAKFEAVASGITTFDREFLAHLVGHNGATVGDALAPQLDAALAGRGAPLALPPSPGGAA